MPRDRQKGLGSIYAALSVVNPLVYLLLYLGLIPLFAAFYWIIIQDHKAQHFYAQYGRREPAALNDKRVVEANLQAALLRALHANQATMQKWIVDPEALHVFSLTLPTEGDPESGGQGTFRLYTAVEGHINGRKFTTGGSKVITLDLPESRFSDNIDTWVCHQAAPPEIRPEMKDYDPDFRVLLTAPPMSLGQSICWNDHAEQKFKDLLAGWRGDPRVLTGAFGRMLYFSATTVTTVGFGDIVPLSEIARVLTGFESVLGWVVAGLFLNAVAGRASARREAL